jgi:hypothetical protein
LPVLKRPAQRREVTLPPRSAIYAGETDVLVVGGGPAGLGAALGARAAGCRVVLAERYGFLGGNATAALVMPLMSFHTEHATREKTGEATLLPTDHGPGDPVIAGVLRSLLERLVRTRGAVPPSLETGFVVPFDPEALKRVALEMLEEAGVELLLHAFASDVYGEPPSGVVFETKSGPVVIGAHAIVDCTGDGDVAVRAGAGFEIGREADGLVQPMTLMFRMIEFERERFAGYVRDNPAQWRGVHGLWDLVKKASEAGELDLPREDILFFATPHAREVSVNSTRVTRVLGTDVWDLTHAELMGRRQLAQIEAFLRRHVPGFEQSYLAQSGVQVGVRETRRVSGEYQLTADDMLGARKFDDAVARGTYPVDIHNPTGRGTTLRRIPPGEWYEIPLRSLLPKGIERVILAGRCISGTHEALSAYRVMPNCVATGQAAGACAALAARTDRSLHEVGHREVQRELHRQGASLSPELTRELRGHAA